MTRRHVVAVIVGLVAMALVLVPPLWVRATGEEVTLAIRPVDPLSLFRGNYVDLRYDAVSGEADPAPIAGVVAEGGVVYAVFSDTRPGRLLRVGRDRPRLAAGEFCIRGRASYGSISFPQLEQFFVTPERGRELERHLSDMVAVIKVTSGCRAVLVDLEPRVSAP
jgi:uncharacterized membrane-anchored protein